MNTTQTTMTKTAALKAAQAAITMPMGKGTSWTVIGPYSGYKGAQGYVTSRDTDSYNKAMRLRSQWVAEIALGLMGYDDMSYEVSLHDGLAVDILDVILGLHGSVA